MGERYPCITLYIDQIVDVMANSAQGREFRLDINGLRAWAVLAVVLYHFNVPGISGGFSGVDVFFVISGYLMASIVVGGLHSERFELLGFYLSRARRIVPALIVLVLVVLLVGWFVLMPHDYQILGRHARESVFFMSNLRFMAEAGYFDAAANTKWLLHTWSLSVEWQFYLLYPLILLALHRIFQSGRVLLFGHLLVLLLSFVLSVYLMRVEEERAFFWLPSRAWELLSGSMVYFIAVQFSPSVRLSRVMTVFGLLLILWSILGVDSSLPWPGYWALPAVLGTSLVILARDQGSWVTNAYLLQWLGERSYSLYLWHWPIVVLLVYFGLEGNFVWIVLGIACSFFACHLSYHWVEMPARRSLSSLSVSKALSVILIAMIVVAVSAQLIRRSGIPGRLPEDVYVLEQERKNKNPRQDECLDDRARCVFGGERVQAFVLGDSHADAVVTGVVAALDNPEYGVAFRGASSCLFIFNAKRMDGRGQGCGKLREDVLSELAAREERLPVFIVNRTTVYAQGRTEVEGNNSEPLVYFEQRPSAATKKFLSEFEKEYVASVCALAKVADIYLIRPLPEMSVNVPRFMGVARLRGRYSEVKLPIGKYHERHSYTWGIQDKAVQQCGVRVLNPLPYLCDDNYCFGSEGGLPLYVDDDHLSERGNRKLTPMFQDVLARSGTAEDINL